MSGDVEVCISLACTFANIPNICMFESYSTDWNKHQSKTQLSAERLARVVVEQNTSSGSENGTIAFEFAQTMESVILTKVWQSSNMRWTTSKPRSLVYREKVCQTHSCTQTVGVSSTLFELTR